MNITRIKSPKFRVGRYILNKYELRQLMYEVNQGLKPDNLIVTDSIGNKARIKLNGKLNQPMHSFDIGTKTAINHFKYNLKHHPIK